MRQSTLTFLILSFLDGLVQLPITQPPLVNRRSHPIMFSCCTNILPPPPQTLLSDLICRLRLLLSLDFSEVQFRLKLRSVRKTSLIVPCWLSFITSDASSNPCMSNTEWLHPSLCSTKSSEVIKQSKPNQTLLKAAQSLQQNQHHCLFLITLINVFNPPLSLPFLLFPFYSHSLSSLSLALSFTCCTSIQVTSSTAWRVLEGELRGHKQRGINPFHLRLKRKMGWKKRKGHSREMEKKKLKEG